MTYAYQPDGLLFVFDEDGKTLARDIKDKGAALFWILKRLAAQLRAAA